MNKSPVDTYDTSDPGDDMQLRIRYQHGYGLILLCAAINKNIPFSCKSLWFEQRDDILIEKDSSRFDFVQVKTRLQTQGEWKITDNGLVKSIKRFCEFEEEFGQFIDRFKFVSNCPYRESKASTKEREQALSPINFFKSLKGLKDYSKIEGQFKLRFDNLSKSIGFDKSTLLCVLRKVKLVVGPPLENFELELSMTHLLKLPQLKDKNFTQINRIRDELSQQIFNASSLNVDDPYKHIFCQLQEENLDPRVLAKKRDINWFEDFLNNIPQDVFRYFKNSSELQISSSERDLVKLKKKLDRAGLGLQYESIKRRALSAEQHFLEEANKNPEDFNSILDQVEGTVLTVCSDALLDTTEGNKINGIEAFKLSRKNLENISINNPNRVASNNSECLIGVAGLLTGECKLWWSEEFDMDEGL